MIDFAIIIHAILGGLSLLSGILALSVRKGSKIHIHAGRIFFWSLITSSLLARFISLLPGHKNLFLFAIAIFTIYLISIGFLAPRAIRSARGQGWIEKSISGTMAIAGVAMIIVPVVVSGSLNIVLTVFGGIGFLLALRDFRLYRNPAKFKQNWLMVHLANMIGGLIAATTAFIVVNELLPGLTGWLAPTVAGVGLILFWRIRLGKQGQ